MPAPVVQVLGGRVDALAEAWEFQRKYGSLHRDAEAQSSSTDRPPPFTPFVPGKTRALHPGVLADIYKSLRLGVSLPACSMSLLLQYRV